METTGNAATPVRAGLIERPLRRRRDHPPDQLSDLLQHRGQSVLDVQLAEELLPSFDVRDHCGGDDVRELTTGGAGGGLEQAFAQLLRDSAAQLEDRLAKLLLFRPMKGWIPQYVGTYFPVALGGRKLLEDPGAHDPLHDDVVPPIRQSLVPDDRRRTAERPKPWPISVLRFPPGFELRQR